MSREEFFDEAMRAADSEPDQRRPPQDLGGHDDEGTTKPLPLPADHLGRERKLRDPLAQVPGQACDFQPGAVARELGHGIAPSCDPAAELLARRGVVLMETTPNLGSRRAEGCFLLSD